MSVALIIDDHPIVLEGCRRVLLDAGFDQVLEAAAPLAGFKLFRRARPDLVIVDLSIRGAGLAGLSLIRRLRLADGRIPILVFSMHGDPVIAAARSRPEPPASSSRTPAQRRCWRRSRKSAGNGYPPSLGTSVRATAEGPYMHYPSDTIFQADADGRLRFDPSGDGAPGQIKVADATSFAAPNVCAATLFQSGGSAIKPVM